jgi:hypothetical protein
MVSRIVRGQRWSGSRALVACAPLVALVPLLLPTACSSGEPGAEEPRTDCFFSIAVNTNATPVSPVLDNLRFTP